MTMVAGHHSNRGIVLISDSRVTWGPEESEHFQDALQKIVPLNEGLVLAFAGDVRAAERIISELRIRISKKPQLKVARKLAAEIPRIAKHFYSVHQSRFRNSCGLDLMLAGRELGGQTGLWVFQSPAFASRQITEGLKIIGSGMAVTPLLQSSMPPTPPNPSLKQIADALMIGLDSALKKKGIATVGGMFQILTISPTEGIRPMSYGHIDLNPDTQPSGMWMTLSKGKWTQEDLTTGQTTSLVEPALLQVPALHRTVDYQLGETKASMWHLVRFLVCRGFASMPDKTLFREPATIFGAEKYPLETEVLVVTSFWGTPGEHELNIVLKVGEESTVLGSTKYKNLYLPEEIEFVSKVHFKIQESAQAFIEAYIDDKLLARRALRFGVLSGEIPSDPSELVQFSIRQDAIFKELQKNDTDPLLESDLRVGVAYFVLCQSVQQGHTLQFNDEFRVAYWKTYPLLLRCCMALAFRAKPGEHHLKLILVNSATRVEEVIDTGKCISNSSCLTTAFEGNVVIKVPKPGIYFINAILDGKRLATKLLVAETDKAQFSYSLLSEDVARVKAGELLLLSGRSQQRPK